MTSNNPSEQLERLTWLETKMLIRSDYQRLRVERLRRVPFATGKTWLSLSFLCVLLFRLSSHNWRAGRTWLSRMLWHLNILLTGTDISPPADIGEGLVILHPTGTAIMGSIGKNFTVVACSGVGGELGRNEKVANWPGVPLIGDNVTLEPLSGILGPVRVGNRVRLCPGAIVTRDIPDDSAVKSPRSRIMKQNTSDKENT